MSGGVSKSERWSLQVDIEPFVANSSHSQGRGHLLDNDPRTPPNGSSIV